MLFEDDIGYMTFHLDSEGDLVDLEMCANMPEILNDHQMMEKISSYLIGRLNGNSVQSQNQADRNSLPSR
jgi:hypothetical protein